MGPAACKITATLYLLYLMSWELKMTKVMSNLAVLKADKRQRAKMMVVKI